MASNALKLSAADLTLCDSFRNAARAFQERTPTRTALVVGATGEVGREVVKHLLATPSFDKVTVFARRSIDYSGPNASKLEQKPVDFEDEARLKQEFVGHTHAFSCLGTTRAKAGKDGFYKVDHDYNVNVARACKSAGVKHYSICSSSGANENSLFLYTKTKGQVDREVSEMGFDRVSIFRPGMLVADRDEYRLMERMAGAVLSIVNYFIPRHASAKTSTVAWNMVYNTFKDVEVPVTEIFSNADIVDTFNEANKE